MIPTTEELQELLRPWAAAPRWWLALSGGLDSSCLLHLISQLPERPPLHALHVNHGLSAQADVWQTHCQTLCQRLDIPLAAHRAQVQLAGQGLEAAARTARYGVFEQCLGPGELLLMAHHGDDQVETFFLRLLRGAGTGGLAGMPASRQLGAGQLLRPLLACRRADLEAYATQHGLDWVEDDSNADQQLDRNYLRHTVLPLLESRWPGYRESIRQSMRAVEEAELNQVAAVQPLLDGAAGQHWGEPTLDLDRLGDLKSHTLEQVLRHWCRQLGLEPPGRERLREFVRQLSSWDGESAPQLPVSLPAILSDRGNSGSPHTPQGDSNPFCLERFQQRLHLRSLAPDPVGQWTLRPGSCLWIPGMGEVSIREMSGGLSLPASGSWQLRCRTGGEHCKLPGRPRRSLKKLLQEQGLPPWWRRRLPLLFAGEQLAAVADLWVCEGAEAPAGETGYGLRWIPLGC